MPGNRYERAARRVRDAANPVLVYQMGKVASDAVAQALRAVHPHVFHVHRMDQRVINAIRPVDSPHRFMGMAVHEHLIVPKRPAHVVTLIREPIARNVSAYFENHWQRDPSVTNFLERYHHHVPLTWFDMELKSVLGIDVYERPFDQDRGWTVLDHHLWPVLVMRHDLPDDLKVTLLRDFTELPVDEIPPANVAASKPYADAYRAFLAEAKFPPDYVDQMLDSRYATHFFSPEERAKLKEKWTAAP